MIDDIHAELDNSGKYYKNCLNDSNFNTTKNNNNQNNDKYEEEEDLRENSQEQVEYWN